MTVKNWKIAGAGDSTTIAHLRSILKVDPIIARLLAQRNITSYEEAEDFFNPSLEKLHDPFLMKGMEEAFILLKAAISNQRRILLYGDYDVDGTSAVALLYTVLKNYSPSIVYYIPDRYNEGYGLSDNGVDYAIDEGIDLLITLDCGIRSVDKIARLRAAGIDVIVCDHHLPGDQLPDCCILDPKQKGCLYPYKELSGCGVGFKLLQGLVHANIIEAKVLYENLDLVAISIAADIVDVLGENRILAYYGLKQLNENPRIAFKEMIAKSGRSLPFTITDVVFTIAPRINAAGRLRSGRFAVALMTEPNSDEIKRLAEEIENDNLIRRELDQAITMEALELIAHNGLEENYTTVLHSNNWHKGVVGIVASRLIEQYYRPTIVFSGNGELLTGSARSIPGINIHDVLEQCADLLVQFGGHAFAAGMTIERVRLDEFSATFEAIVKSQLKPSDRKEEITIDAEIQLNDLFSPQENRLQIPRFKRILDRFEPFGPGNMKPNFISRNLFATEARVLKEQHLKVKVTQPPGDLVIDGIGFGLAAHMDTVAAGIPFDMVYTLDSNTWNDRTTLQLMIRDLRESQF